jgi:hypothetical protein
VRARRLITAPGYLVAGLAAFAIGVIGVAVLVLVIVGKKADADSAKARAEVQKFYDARLPGRGEVVDCDYVEVDSVFDQFACSIKVKCAKRLTFSVPRAAALLERVDSPVSTDRRAERPRCRT